MLFSSMEFLFVFFPIVLGIYFLLPHKARNYWLLLGSLFFYAWGEPVFVIAMVFSIVFNYFLALRIEELATDSRVRKLMLAITVVVNLGILFVYKYMNFVTKTLQELGAEVTVTEYVLPIGISFFTFQALSYVIDVYRGIPAQKNICYVGLYIALFPQLIAGPIVRYTTIMDEMERRDVSWDDFSTGMLRFLRGFNKKVLLANLLSKVADAAFGAKELSASFAWLGALAYALQIYFDFGGYSDMAIGLGRMFGFHFLENFNYPYISKTVTEFWRRWHISLGTWFRDYLYFPLGGSRVKSKVRLFFNLAVVWMATGIWHGASWHFVFWGMLHGGVIIVEKLWKLPEKLEKKRWLSVLYQIFTMVIVLIGWVFFRAKGLRHGLRYTMSMFGLNGNPLFDATTVFYATEYLVLFVAGILCALPLLKKCRERLEKRGGRLLVAGEFAGALAQFVLFLLSVSFLVMNAHNPFIYFNF